MRIDTEIGLVGGKIDDCAGDDDDDDDNSPGLQVPCQ